MNALPDFTRVVWASPKAREVWQPRVDAVMRDWAAVERLSVLEGVRQAALFNVQQDDLVGESAWAAKNGLALVPLARVRSSGSYNAVVAPAVEGQPWSYRVVLVRPEHAGTASAQDDSGLGELLGYPACCRSFFDATWGQGMLDTTWPMHQAAGPNGPLEANILLRWLGVRAVPHLPCSFTCAETVALGARMLELCRPEVAEWTREMLGWAMSWSALHGVAEIRTPVLRITTRTDYTPAKVTFERAGEVPALAPSGLVYPHKRQPLVQLTQSKKHKAGVRAADPREWTDNGFSSREAMDRAHGAIVTVAEGMGRPPASVVDLGCGNGRLLERLGEVWPEAKLFGVEYEAARAQRAHVPVTIGSMFDVTVPDAELVLLMPGRLIEVGERSARLRAWLAGRTLIVYGYGDWVGRYGSLGALCQAAGLPAPHGVATASGVSAGRIDLQEGAD